MKTWFRITMAQERLTGLASLSIENESAGLFRNLGFIQFQKRQRNIFLG
jgi:hypothetical protein